MPRLDNCPETKSGGVGLPDVNSARISHLFPIGEREPKDSNDFSSRFV